MDKFLYCQWNILWKRIGVINNKKIKKAFFALKEKYSKPHRFYHNLNHIAHCLIELKEVRSLARNINILELAIWYHDIEGDEEQSAKLAVKIIKNLQPQFKEKELEEIKELIKATNHLSFDEKKKNFFKIDEKLIIDVDLSILGQKRERFIEYEKLIAKEYNHIPRKLFLSGRIFVLKSFLRREHIYLTPYFRNKYERQARKNLMHSLLLLELEKN